MQKRKHTLLGCFARGNVMNAKQSAAFLNLSGSVFSSWLTRASYSLFHASSFQVLAQNPSKSKGIRDEYVTGRYSQNHSKGGDEKKHSVYWHQQQSSSGIQWELHVSGSESARKFTQSDIRGHTSQFCCFCYPRLESLPSTAQRC